jgi:ATP-dependent helicase IRC3
VIELRTYQIEARDAVRKEWESGIQKTLLVAATGAGKTEMSLSVLAAEHAAGCVTRILWVAHRQELITQPVDRIKAHWADQVPAPGIVMAAKDDAAAKLVVATVQSLNKRRLEKLLKHGSFSHMLIDEAHHATSRSYATLIGRLLEANPKMRIMGVTATPRRADRDGLKKVFQSVAYKISVKDAIVRLRCLVPFSVVGVRLPVSFKDVKVIGEDYEQELAGKIMAADNATEIIVDQWKKHAANRKTMMFASSVHQARESAKAFQKAGISAAWASGATPKKDRDEIIKRFKEGKIKVLVNCALWTEGFDVPEVNCVIMAKPTKSDSIYLQCVGRGLRLAEGKTDCLIMDFVPEDEREFRLGGDLLGKPKKLRKKEAEAKQKGVIIEAFQMDKEGEGIDVDPDEVQLQVLDYFSASKIAWTFDGGIATVTVGERTAMAVVLPDQSRIDAANKLRERGLWKEAYQQLLDQIRRYRVFAVKNSDVKEIGAVDDWEAAALMASDYADEWGDKTLMKRKNEWRRQPASAGQITFMKQLKLPVRDGISKGEAAQAITHKLTLNQLIRKGVVRVKPAQQPTEAQHTGLAIASS